MTVIKRYSNRKLYDTERKRYITLEGIAVLVRQGEDISVVDNETSDDLTNLILSQIILEQEKQKSGYIPKSILTALVKASDTTVDTLRKKLNQSVDYIRQVDEEIEERIQALVDRGELAMEDGQKLRQHLVDMGKTLRTRAIPTKDRLQDMLVDLDLPSREDMDNISDQIDRINAKIEELLAKKMD